MGFYNTIVSPNIHAINFKMDNFETFYLIRKIKKCFLLKHKILSKSCGRIRSKYRCMWKILAFSVTAEKEEVKRR